MPIKALAYVLVGTLIIFTGIISAATLTNGFIGYFRIFIFIPESISIILTIGILTTLAIWGIAESLIVAAIITLVEILGLVLVLFFCGDVLQQFPERAYDFFVPQSFSDIIVVFSGAFLAFYAFIGFEDIVNIAEEVKNPEQTMPKAILLAIIISSLLYILIALTSIMSLPLDTLSASEAPLALMVQNHTLAAQKTIAAIGVFAIVNGVLIQIIMASRVLYGMAKKQVVPTIFASVNATTQTPVISTIFIGLLILLFSLLLPLVTLAKLTSFIILVIFTVVNLSLWKIKQKPEYKHRLHQKHFPLTGAFPCLSLLAFQLIAQVSSVH